MEGGIDAYLKAAILNDINGVAKEEARSTASAYIKANLNTAAEETAKVSIMENVNSEKDITIIAKVEPNFKNLKGFIAVENATRTATVILSCSRIRLVKEKGSPIMVETFIEVENLVLAAEAVSKLRLGIGINAETDINILDKAMASNTNSLAADSLADSITIHASAA